ncbi:unnamed protein product [Pleuronectes platessa]|uniref:Ig-like domain-containing protein n=1 Tax=Pleuronectes platessa TaxID=8262 RepID=A0A9N7Z3Y1_PLEPL|nr:unnamed protein product [Pleuronectes platessa]
MCGPCQLKRRQGGGGGGGGGLTASVRCLGLQPDEAGAQRRSHKPEGPARGTHLFCQLRSTRCQALPVVAHVGLVNVFPRSPFQSPRSSFLKVANQAGGQQMWQDVPSPPQSLSSGTGEQTLGLRMVLNICLLLCSLALPLQGLEIFDPEEVEYIRSHVTAAAGGSVTLHCGSTMPSIFIWGFTKPGTDSNMAVAYNYGQGPKLQAQSGSLGRLQVPVNTSALVIEELGREAGGMYTCQALYDTEEGARITFYFTRLDVEDD